jgi:hypothetical protein
MCLWSLRTGKDVLTIKGPKTYLWTVTYAPRGASFGSTTGEGSVILWDSESGKEKARFHINDETVVSIAIAISGKFVAAGEAQGVRILSLEEDKQEHSLIDGVRDVCFVALGQCDKTLVSVSSDKKVRLWDMNTRKLRKELDANCVVASCSRDGRMLAVSDEKKKAIRVYDLDRDRWVATLDVGEMKVHHLAMSPDGEFVAHGDRRSFVLSEILSGQPVIKHELPADLIASIAYAPDGRTIASGNGATAVILWDCTGCRWDRLRLVLETPKLDLIETFEALGGKDAVAANRAVWTLSTCGKPVLALLREQLKPVTAEQNRIRQLLDDLASDVFETRKAASQELERIGDGAEPLLQERLASDDDLESNRQIGKILDKIQASPSYLRAHRAVRLLEAMGGEEAVKILEQLASGTKDVARTRKASEALARLKARNALRPTPSKP